VIVLGEDENDPFRELPVVKVAEEHRKKLKYSCAACKPVAQKRALPCVVSCKSRALKHSW
jgi:hypothetical protein